MLTVGEKFPSFELTAWSAPTRKKPSSPSRTRATKASGSCISSGPRTSPSCVPTEIAGFGKVNREFQDRDCQILGCSIDSEYVHLAWRRTMLT